MGSISVLCVGHTLSIGLDKELWQSLCVLSFVYPHFPFIVLVILCFQLTENLSLPSKTQSASQSNPILVSIFYNDSRCMFPNDQRPITDEIGNWRVA